MTNGKDTSRVNAMKANIPSRNNKFKTPDVIPAFMALQWFAMVRVTITLWDINVETLIGDDKGRSSKIEGGTHPK